MANLTSEFFVCKCHNTFWDQLKVSQKIILKLSDLLFHVFLIYFGSIERGRKILETAYP